jgi:hypothetical protein
VCPLTAVSPSWWQGNGSGRCGRCAWNTTYINDERCNGQLKNSHFLQEMNASLTFGVSALIALAASALVTIRIIVLMQRFHSQTDSWPHSPIQLIVFNHNSSIYDEENGIPLSWFDAPKPVYFPDGPWYVHFQRYDIACPDSDNLPPVRFGRIQVRTGSPPQPDPSQGRTSSIPTLPPTPTVTVSSPRWLPHAPMLTNSSPQSLHRHAHIHGHTHDIYDQFGC